MRNSSPPGRTHARGCTPSALEQYRSHRGTRVGKLARQDDVVHTEMEHLQKPVFHTALPHLFKIIYTSLPNVQVAKILNTHHQKPLSCTQKEQCVSASCTQKEQCVSACISMLLLLSAGPSEFSDLKTVEVICLRHMHLLCRSPLGCHMHMPKSILISEEAGHSFFVQTALSQYTLADYDSHRT